MFILNMLITDWDSILSLLIVALREYGHLSCVWNPKYQSNNNHIKVDTRRFTSVPFYSRNYKVANKHIIILSFPYHSGSK